MANSAAVVCNFTSGGASLRSLPGCALKAAIFYRGRGPAGLERRDLGRRTEFATLMSTASSSRSKRCRFRIGAGASVFSSSERPLWCSTPRALEGRTFPILLDRFLLCMMPPPLEAVSSTEALEVATPAALLTSPHAARRNLRWRRCGGCSRAVGNPSQAFAGMAMRRWRVVAMLPPSGVRRSHDAPSSCR